MSHNINDHIGRATGEQGDGELFSDAERHAHLSQLNLAAEWITLYSRAATEDLLARVDEYLTERCDRAYVASYRSGFGTASGTYAHREVDAWMELGDARELVRKRLKELRGEKLKGTKHIDGRILNRLE